MPAALRVACYRFRPESERATWGRRGRPEFVQRERVATADSEARFTMGKRAYSGRRDHAARAIRR